MPILVRTINRFLTLFYFSLTTTYLMAQVLPKERVYDWHEAGFSKPDIGPQVLNILDFGGSPDGGSDNSGAFERMLEKASESSAITTMLFPAGTYLFHETLNLPSNVLIKGSSSTETQIRFSDRVEGNGISVRGNLNGKSWALRKKASMGSKTLVLDQLVFDMKPGDVVLLGDRDEALVHSSWAEGSTGQMNEVVGVGGDTLFLKYALRRDYPLASEPTVYQVEPISNVGIECLKIRHEGESEQHSSNVLFRYAANCWIQGIESELCNFAHVDFEFSLRCQVEGSYFHTAHDYGSGGSGYGVMLSYASSNCLIYNNIFRELRHSMILQAGANGNVFLGNYSREPFWEDVSLPDDAAGDLVLHGNYPYANLFESNNVENIVIDNSHGINGPDNLFFRNRADLYGIFMNDNPASDRQAFIGNEITNRGFLKGLYSLEGEDHFEFANNFKGTALPLGTDELSDTSYYFSGVGKAESSSAGAGPIIGLPNRLASKTIDARSRYFEGNLATCGQDVPTHAKPRPSEKSALLLKGDMLSVSGTEVDAKPNIQVFNSNGQLLAQGAADQQISIRSLPTGVYVARAYTEGGQMMSLRFAKRR